MMKPLILPMMMYGKFRTTRVKKDNEGNTIYKRNPDGSYKLDKHGRKIPEKEKVWIYHREEDNDPGVYPSVNHIYVINMKHGKKRLSAPAEKLKEKWEVITKEWMEENNWKTTSKEKIVIEVTPYFPNDNIRRDSNNAFKLMMDAFNGLIYDDDYYGLPRVMDFAKVQDGESPYFEVYIYKKDDEYEILQQRIRQTIT